MQCLGRELTKKSGLSVLVAGLILVIMVCPVSGFRGSPGSGVLDQQGRLLEMDISGPGLSPPGWNMTSDASGYHIAAQKTIDGVPALLWSYGCTPTSAAMLFGYYDRHGYPNIYTGQMNSGVFPLTSTWGPQTIEPNPSNGECPLSASHSGIDGRLTKGHADDYYYGAGSVIDPYFGLWTEHSPDSLADFMGTSQYHTWGTSDGTTMLYFDPYNSPTIDPVPEGARDGAHGMKLFAESRGYTVETVYNQRIAGFNGLPAGFTFAQYKAEIDNNHPVLISVTGHTMIGVGYSDPDQIIFHNTWDPNLHTMTWGGSYEGMAHRSVTVFHLSPIISLPTVTGITPSGGANTGSVSVSDLAGTNFTDGALVHLTRPGFADISATGVTVVSPTRITCVLPLSGMEPGSWNVVVINPDTHAGILNNGFTIFAPVSPVTFSAAPVSGRAPLTVAFTDQSINGPIAWNWSFGDGDTANATLQNPVHTYTAPGIYDVSLNATNATESGTFTRPAYIAVSPPAFPFGIGVYRPSAYSFYLRNESVFPWTTVVINWGASTDLPVAGDWNGDGVTDVGVFRPSTHTFFLKNGTALSWTTTAINWGASTDLPVTGDWNGDGVTDVGVFRSSTHTFFLKNGTALSWTTTAINWGASTDLPVTGTW